MMHEDVELHGNTDMCMALAKLLIEVGRRSYLPRPK